MFLIIPEVILRSPKLTSDEKLVLSMAYHLTSRAKPFYASEVYLYNNMGLVNGRTIIENLIKKKYLEDVNGDLYVPASVCKRIESKEV